MKISTNLENKIADKITSDNFPFGRFVKIAEMLIRRQSRRSLRMLQNKPCKADQIQGFDPKNYQQFV